MRTNVVHLVDDLKVGGLERTLATIVENLDKTKYEVSVWCLIGEGQIAEELKNKGFEIKVLNFLSRNKLCNLLRLIRRLKKEKVEIIHCWGISGGIWGRFASILARVPIRFAHVQNTYDDFGKKERLIERFLGFFSDRIIACSEAVKKCLTEFVGIKPHKIETIYNSIEIQKFNRVWNTQAIRNEFKLKRGDIIIGNVSRLVPIKGHRYLLEAAVKIIEKFPRIKFLIVGDGPLKSSLEAKTEELGIKEKVIFTGWRQDIPRLLSIMDIFVLPSLREGLGVAILEAMYLSRPVIATNVGGVPEVVKDGETGILVPPRDIQALTKGLSFLLQNPQKAKEMGKAGGKLCEKTFSSVTMMKKIHQLYTFYIDKKLKGRK